MDQDLATAIRLKIKEMAISQPSLRVTGDDTSGQLSGDPACLRATSTGQDLATAIRLKISENVSASQPILSETGDDTLAQPSGASIADQLKETNQELPDPRRQASVEQLAACFAVGTEFYIWLFAFFLVPILQASSLQTAQVLTTYLLSCVGGAGLIILGQIFILVCAKIRHDQPIRPSWLEFFPDTVERELHVDLEPALAFERCIAVLNKTLWGYSADSLDIYEHEIVVSSPTAYKFRVSVKADDKGGSTIELKFLQTGAGFWHYLMIVDWGTRQDYLRKFERALAAMEQVPPGTFAKIRTKRRAVLNKTQLCTILSAVVVAIVSLAGPSGYQDLQRSDLRNHVNHCFAIDWTTHQQLAISEFTKVINKAESLHLPETSALAHLYRGYVEEQCSLLPQAQADLEQAIAISKEANKEESREASNLSFYQSIYQPQVTEATAKRHLTAVLLKQGRLSDADALLQQVIDDAKANLAVADIPFIHYLKGLRELKEGHNDAAVSHLLLSSNKEAKELLPGLLLSAKDDLSALHRAAAIRGSLIYPTAHANTPYQTSPVANWMAYVLGIAAIAALARWTTRYCTRKATTAKTFVSLV